MSRPSNLSMSSWPRIQECASNQIASTADGSAIVCDTIWRMARYSESHSFSTMLASGKSGSIIVPRTRVTGRVGLRRKNSLEQRHFGRKSSVNSGNVGVSLGAWPTPGTMTNPRLQSYSSLMADGSSKTSTGVSNSILDVILFLSAFRKGFPRIDRLKLGETKRLVSSGE